jgi:hypothetical protein
MTKLKQIALGILGVVALTAGIAGNQYSKNKESQAKEYQTQLTQLEDRVSKISDKELKENSEKILRIIHRKINTKTLENEEIEFMHLPLEKQRQQIYGIYSKETLNKLNEYKVINTNNLSKADCFYLNELSEYLIKAMIFAPSP